MDNKTPVCIGFHPGLLPVNFNLLKTSNACCMTRSLKLECENKAALEYRALHASNQALTKSINQAVVKLFSWIEPCSVKKRNADAVL